MTRVTNVPTDMMPSQGAQYILTQSLERITAKLLEVLKAANRMLTTLRGTAEAITEAEKFRIKNLVVNNLEKSKGRLKINTPFQTSNRNNIDEQESIEFIAQNDLNRNTQHNLEVSDETRENCNELKRPLEFEKSTTEIHIKRDYKLTKDSNLTI